MSVSVSVSDFFVVISVTFLSFSVKLFLPSLFFSVKIPIFQFFNDAMPKLSNPSTAMVHLVALLVGATGDTVFAA